MVKIETPADVGKVAYSSLYMHQGEKIEKAKEQIKSVCESEPFCWFFDVICTRNQFDAAMQVASELELYIRELMPGLDQEKILVAVNINGYGRQARQIMFDLAKEVNGPVTEMREVKDGSRHIMVLDKFKESEK